MSAGVPRSDAGARRTRVLFLIAHFETGGVQHQLRLRLGHLDPARYECRVAVLTQGQSRWLHEITSLGVPVDMLGLSAVRGFATRIAVVRAYIARIAPDVVDSLLLWDNVYGNLAATLERVPLVIAELQNERTAVLVGWPVKYRVLETIALRHFCDEVVCCSEAVRSSYRRVLAGRETAVHVIHDAVAGSSPQPDVVTARRALGLPIDRPIVGTLGRLTEQKDQRTFLESAAIVLARVPSAVFVIGGYGALATALAEQTRRLGIESSVRFLGEVHDQYAFYAAVDVFVLTSRWEGFPVVLLEVLMSERAVVSTPVGGIPEVVLPGRTGLWGNVGEPASIAGAITRLLEDEPLRHACGRAGRTLVTQRYTIAALIEKWEALYDRPASSGLRDEPSRVPAPVPTAVPAPTSAHWPDDVRELLVWRLCPPEGFRLVVSALQARYPRAHIACACQEEAEAWIAQEHPGLERLVYGRNVFSLFRTSPVRLVRWRRRRFDLTIVPYGNATRQGYRHAEAAGLWVGRGAAVGVFPSTVANAPLVRLCWPRWGRESARELVRPLLGPWRAVQAVVVLCRGLGVARGRRRAPGRVGGTR